MNAARRTVDEGVRGSHPTSGAAAIRPMVIALGRFTGRAGSGKRLEHLLADSLERVEYPFARDGDRLEVRRAFHPLARRKLLDEIFPGMRGIGRDLHLVRLRDLPTGIHRRLELLDR